MGRQAQLIRKPIWLLLVAMLALVALPGIARADESDISITGFKVTPDDLQAGGHPNVNIKMNFCSPGLTITNVTGTGPVIVTTATPHGITEGTTVSVRLAGILGMPHLTSQPNFVATPVTGQPNQLSVSTTTIPADETYQGGGEVLFGPTFGCVTADQLAAFLKDFTLRLPPGFVGNPTAVTPCPTALWLTGACPDSSQVGFAVVDVVPKPSGLVLVNTKVYVIDPVGLEPARLGTEVLLGTPQGPFPNTIKLRSSGDRPDYGIDSSQVNIPKDLGGNTGIVRQIEIFLCSQAPCAETLRGDPNTTVPLPGVPHHPFFVNPTSCTPATTTLVARSWLGPGGAPGVTKTADSTFTPQGCDDVPYDATKYDPVPFDARLDVFPDEDEVKTSEPGKQKPNSAGAENVVIDYCAFGHEPDKCVNGHDYADDDIWQAALQEADVTLPKGLTLSPGGGNGLEGCDFADFGVNPTSPHKQLNDDPPTCPAGSQIGTLRVETPVLPNALSGKAFFGCNRTNPATEPCLTTAGRPTVDNPWKLFLMIEGSGIRVKLAGNVWVDEDGTIHNSFKGQPQVPFNRLEIHLNGGSRSVLATPEDCDNPHLGNVDLKGWNGKVRHSTPDVNTVGCPAEKPFAPQIVSAGSDPEQAGANTTSHIEITRNDGEEDIKSLKLSLPVGAVGSLAAVPMCELSLAQAGACPASTRIGTVKSTVGTGNSLLTAAGSLYLAEPSQSTDAATLALVVPAKAGPIDLGKVVVLNRVILRDSDTGVDAITSDIPNILAGVHLHVRKIEITVDRPGFFLNPTGCDARPLTATFTSYSGRQSTSTMNLAAKGCENLAFSPKLRMIAGAKGLNGQLKHPPLTTIVTQAPGEANIKSSVVILPDLIRPNATQFNVPGGLCSDAQFAENTCPGPSLVGSVRVITPVLPFQLSGPVFVVQEVGSVLPKLYMVLQGRGIRVVLRSRNSFLRAIYTVNTLENLPDVPQAYFELKIKGGPAGILQNFYNACGVRKIHRKIDYTFTGQNGKQVKKVSYLQQEGCARASSLGASISSRVLKVNRKGVGKLKIRCRASKRCKGRISINAKGVKSAKKFSIKAKKSKALKMKFSKKEVRKIFKKKRIKTRAKAKAGGKTTKRSITIVPQRKHKR